MKCITSGWIIAALILGVTWRSKAQEELPQQLIDARNVLVRSISERRPKWHHKIIPPMVGSKGVIIDQWELDGWAIRVAVIQHDSPETAEKTLQDFRSRLEDEERAARNRGQRDFKLIKEELPVLGDGGFTRDEFGVIATAFRKSNLTIYVNVSAPGWYKDQTLSKEVAQIIAGALPSK